ncbi:probable protein kinase UbiB isoform X2 [Prunus dulcis]|nr:probable protein kinase UbiB isoform X2 [Prunus dulcis]
MEFSSFSSGTERAVKTWQASLDAPQDGIATAELEQLYTVAQIEGMDNKGSTLTATQKVDNFIHADMHPGNIPVRLAQSKSSRKRLFKTKPHVIFLDLGTTAELSKSDKSDFKAVALRDGRTAAECTLKLSKQHKCPDPKAFIEQVEEAFAYWGTPEGDLVHPAEYMQQLL